MPRLPDIRQCLIVAGAVVLILLAVSFSLLRAALPYASDYRAELEQQLGAQLGLPVSIASLDAGMDWFTPRLILRQPVVYQPDGETELIRFDEIDLSLAWFDSLRFMSPMLGEINLVGGDLTIVRGKNKRWSIQGVELGGSEAEMPANLLALLENANYALIDSHLVLKDETGEYQDLELQSVNIAVENFLGEHEVRFDIGDMGRYAESLQIVFRFRGSILHVAKNINTVYINASQANIEVWRKELRLDIPYHVSGKHDVQLWLDLEQQQLKSLALDLSSRDIRISLLNNHAAPWRADSLTLKLLWEKQAENWRAAIRDFRYARADAGWKTPTRAIIKQRAGRISVSIDYLQLQEIEQLIKALTPPDQKPRLAELLKLQAKGELYNLFAAYDVEQWRQGEWQFTAKGLGLNLSSLSPQQPVKITGLDMQLHASQGEAHAELYAEQLQVTMNKMFRQTLSFDVLSGALALQFSTDGWTVSSNSLVLENADIKTRTRLLLRQADDGVFADIQTAYHDGRGAAAYKYYPVSEMSPELVAWLDAAITNGVVERGSFLFYGKVADFPFNNNGVMQAEFNVRDMDLNYQQGWPALRKVSSHVLFDNVSMTVDQVNARLFNGKIVDVSARIADMYHPLLKVDGKARAPAKDVQKFIWQSPLDESLGAAMNQLQLGGNVDLTLALSVPLDTDDPIQVKGDISLNGATVRYPELAYELRQVTGKLSFTDKTLRARGVHALMDGARLTIDIGAPETRPDVLRFSFNGNLPIDSLLRRFDWIPASGFEGSSDWRVTLDAPTGDDNQNDAISLQAESDLAGVRIHLSDALQKPAEQKLPLTLQAEITEPALKLTLSMPDNNTIEAQRHNDGNWYVVAKTAWVNGIARFHESMSPDTTVTLQLDDIELSKLLRSTDNSEAVSILPGAIPSLDITTGPLRWQKWKFNSARLQTSSHRLGMVIDEIKVQGVDLRIKGQGSWLTSWRHPHETTLKLSVYSSDFGNALAALGYERIVDRCEQTAEIDWKWNAEPYRFSWGKLTGSASIEMNDGEVTEIDPGAGGRVLGLLNVFHLPRRLFLSFGDVYKKGFVFDAINGDFTFADGNAFTSNTEINASSADVRIQGRIGMQAQDYDLTVRVKPKTSAAAFTGGAIAGGPVVGAGLVLIQKLLGLDKAAQDRYTITGSWDNPVITQIEKAETSAPQSDEPDELSDDIDE